MGMYVDQYVGYMVDVTEEVDALGKDINDLLWYTLFMDDNPMPKDLETLGVKATFADDSPNTGDIEVIFDSNSGRYAKIVLIESVDRYSDNESKPNDLVNEALKKTPVDKEKIEKLAKVYECLFKKPMQKEVYLQQFARWR